jgi:hypothetical protein
MPTPSVHTAQIHRVRIFVVPDSALRGELPPVGKKNLVTPRHLELAHNHVLHEAPDVADDVHAVIVIGDKAATFLDGKLVPHDEAIKHAAIRVHTESDLIEWEADRAFTIVSTEKAEHRSGIRTGRPTILLLWPALRRHLRHRQLLPGAIQQDQAGSERPAVR